MSSFRSRKAGERRIDVQGEAELSQASNDLQRVTEFLSSIENDALRTTLLDMVASIELVDSTAELGEDKQEEQVEELPLPSSSHSERAASLFRLLHRTRGSPLNTKSPLQLISLFCHTLCVHQGLQPVYSVSEGSRDDGRKASKAVRGFAPPIRTIPLDKLVEEGWNEDTSQVRFQYKIKRKKGLYSLSLLAIDDVFVAEFQAQNDNDNADGSQTQIELPLENHVSVDTFQTFLEHPSMRENGVGLAYAESCLLNEDILLEAVLALLGESLDSSFSEFSDRSQSLQPFSSSSSSSSSSLPFSGGPSTGGRFSPSVPRRSQESSPFPSIGSGDLNPLPYMPELSYIPRYSGPGPEGGSLLERMRRQEQEEGSLMGPNHPFFTDPHRNPSFLPPSPHEPRYDPMTPFDLPGSKKAAEEEKKKKKKKRSAGEPNNDHLRPPRGDGDDDDDLSSSGNSNFDLMYM